MSDRDPSNPDAAAVAAEPPAATSRPARPARTAAARSSEPRLDAGSARALVDDFRETFDRLRAELGKVIIGQREVIEEILTALFAGGHVLIEGVPGTGKTLLVRTLAQALNLSFNRIQFTID
jgi:ABC-type uncharacterized transport system fused permease/ATPase subunit